MNQRELKPCRICGRSGDITEVDPTYGDANKRVKCVDLYCTSKEVYAHSYEEAITEWNAQNE